MIKKYWNMIYAYLSIIKEYWHEFKCWPDLQTVQDVSSPMSSWTKHVEDCSVCNFSWLPEWFNVLWKLASSQEHWSSISARIGGNDLSNFNCVICQEVVEHHLPRISKHAVCVIPVAEEAQNMAVMVQELLQGVMLLIWSQWLHALIHLKDKSNLDK